MDKKEICVGKTLTDTLNNLLLKEPKNEDEAFIDATYTFTARFENGYEMDIKVCGVSQFNEDGNNMPWTEAVLFNEKGGECCFTEPGEDIWGTWNIEYNGEIYSAEMIPYSVEKEEAA